jgi:hypothetical protein
LGRALHVKKTIKKKKKKEILTSDFVNIFDKNNNKNENKPQNLNVTYETRLTEFKGNKPNPNKQLYKILYQRI